MTSYSPLDEVDGAPETDLFVVLQLKEVVLDEHSRAAVRYYENGCPEVKGEHLHAWAVCPGECMDSWMNDWDMVQGVTAMTEYSPRTV